MAAVVVGWGGGLLPSRQIKSLKTDWGGGLFSKNKKMMEEELVQMGKLPHKKRNNQLK